MEGEGGRKERMEEEVQEKKRVEEKYIMIKKIKR